jgi:hypothetical protein
MSAEFTFWPTLFLLGAYHGINPGMGWLFAVARGMQEHRTRAVAWSLPPIALGHALSIGMVVLIAGLAQVALPMTYIRVGVAASLVSLGVYKLIRSRHFRWGGMQVGFRELTIWSFLMASAHGAGLMVLPVMLAGPHGHDADSHAGILHRDRSSGVARLSEIRSGDASPRLVQPGSDMGDCTGRHRLWSVVGLSFSLESGVSAHADFPDPERGVLRESTPDGRPRRGQHSVGGEESLRTGEVFDVSRLRLSLLRLNQLGLFEEIRIEDAWVQPSPDEAKVDVNLRVKEKAR